MAVSPSAPNGKMLTLVRRTAPRFLELPIPIQVGPGYSVDTPSPRGVAGDNQCNPRNQSVRSRGVEHIQAISRVIKPPWLRERGRTLTAVGLAQATSHGDKRRSSRENNGHTLARFKRLRGRISDELGAPRARGVGHRESDPGQRPSCYRLGMGATARHEGDG